MTKLQTYNALDTIATFQLWQEVEAQLLRKPEAHEAYTQAQALSAPLMYMMTRGLLVDESAVQPLHDQFIQECKELEAIADQITKPLLKAVINFSSPKQVIWMFECLGVKMPTKRDKGVTKKRTDREGFEQIAKQHPDLSPLVNIIMAWRDRAKMLTVLNPELYDADNRMRTFYKVAGTVTDRLASAKNALWTGMNMQNVKRDEDEEKTGRASIRSIFVADKGKKFLNIDLKGADSWGVGLGVFEATGDPSYLDACGSRDLHTHVARLVWPERPWTGNWSHDKALAEEFFYRQYDYRFMCKKGGHGCVPPDHEVLTPDGWVSIADKPTKIMSFDNGCEWSNVEHWNEFDYNGELIKLDGTSVSLIATPNHRIIHTLSQNEGVLREIPASHFESGQIPLGWGFKGGDLEVADAAFVAAVQADGHVKSTNRVEFHLRKSRKVERLYRLCESLGYEIYDKGDDRYIVHYTMKWPKLAGAYLLNWSERSLRIFLKEHQFWDGHIAKTSISLSSVHRSHLEWIQTINRLFGFGGNIQKPHISGFGSTVYTLQDNNRRWAWGKSIKKSKVDYEGKVYCPTVPSGMFLVRHNGKIHVTGNSNYLGKPYTLAMQMKIPIWVAERFQRAYFREFPGIPKWHRIKARELQTTGMLRNQFGRVRHFHSRLDADSTLREAIGWLGQSCTAGTTNRGMLNVWALQCSAPAEWGLELMAQVHDSLLMQYNEAYETEALAACLEAMSIPLTAVSPTGESRTVVIPLEPSVGWNWAKLHKNRTTGHVSNPDGLVELKPGQTDDRTRLHTPSQKKERFMDKRLSGVHRVLAQSADFSEVGSDLDDWSLSGTSDLGYDSEAA